ncbi:unnamed protein product [Allacma fusca]|uniref:Uncharacterized protein n=1 Tax=Allacma fusca TaxID=39272 RepID=A0A8J2NYH0_9HEXA|nr:unnamed protein product [Allacma fusca]
MAPNLAIPKLSNVMLVNVNVFFALPFIIEGICVNEFIIFGNRHDGVGGTVTAFTFVCSLLTIIHVWRPRLRWLVLLVISVSILASLIFVVIILGENAVPTPEIWDRNRLNENGTSCFEDSLNDSTTCYATWKDDAKSSLSLLFSNTMLGINTVLIRPISLPS